ncbi:glycosyltransferase [Roseibium sp.]|uniref:glycosyltransferase n=1 Tax=Roseibium sp. TaxID=1936156 RepID=UPI003B52671F
MTNSTSATPLVSVVMPVYNHARYVADALLSIAKQDWRPLEIIVIDDGSKDDSLEVLKRTVAELPQEDGLTIHVSGRENKGAHNTINEGLEKATGEYLAILNSDDYFLPGRIRRCVETAMARKARFVCTYVDPIDDDGNPLPADHRWRHWYSDLKMQELDLAPNISSLLLRYNIGVSTGNFLFHRSLIEEIGTFEDYRYAHDLDFMLRASALEEPVLIRDKLYAYRVHATNTIGESDDRITDEVAGIVAKYLKNAAENPPVNPIAPAIDRDCYSLASTPWPPHLEKATASLMYDKDIVEAQKANADKSLSTPALALSPEGDKKQSAVTLISHELSRTGAPVLLRDVASALHGMGVATRVISLGAGPLVDDYTKMHSPVVTEGRVSRLLGRAGNFLTRLAGDPRIPGFMKPLFSFAAKGSAGVGSRLRLWHYRSKTLGKGPLLINSFASWPLALPLLEKWSGPAFWYIHETYEPSLVMRSGKMLARLEARAKAGNLTFLFGSDATRQKWAEEGYDGEVFYWSGFDKSCGRPAGSEEVRAAGGKPVILSVQSTGPRKGTRSLIEAFALGRAKGWIPMEAELHIIGAHPPAMNALSRDLLVRILKDDLRGSVQLIPNLSPDELAAHYASASVYVQSSTMECLPLALLNAMAFGMPIVSTDADGCREAILDGKTGRLVPPRQPELLAEALGQLLTDPALASDYGRSARTLFEEKFALEVTASKLMQRLTNSAG